MTKINTDSSVEFLRALKVHEADYGVELNDTQRRALCDYYEILGVWNARLHLVAPCSPAEFATRHVLESLFILRFVKRGARLCDVGSGGGLPAVPCLIVRPDVSYTLIESNLKKSVFLSEALARVGRSERSEIINARFENVSAPIADFVTCRALDRFAEMFDALVAWSPRESTLLFFGGHALGERVERGALAHTRVQVPRSNERFIFIIKRPPTK